MRKIVSLIVVVVLVLSVCSAVLAGPYALEKTQQDNKKLLCELKEIDKKNEKLLGELSTSGERLSLNEMLAKFKDINDTIMRDTEGLAYQMADLEAGLTENFQSYSDLKGSISNMPDFQKEYRDIVDTQKATVKDTMKSLDAMNKDLSEDTRPQLDKLLKLARDTQGRNQILQAANELQAFNAMELTKLRELMMIQVNLTAAAMRAEVANTDATQVTHEKIFERPKSGGVGNSDPDYWGF